jgi:hypothetical protein
VSNNVPNAPTVRWTVNQDGGTVWTGIPTVTAPAVSPGGSGTIFFDSTLNVFRVSQNGGAYANLVGGGGVPGGANTNVQYNNAGAFGGSAEFTFVVATGTVTLTQPVVNAATPNLFVVTGGAHTALVAGTEAIDVNFNLSRAVQFDTGALALQRAVNITAPTYGFVAASTLTTAATLYITNCPQTGINATITDAYALMVAAGRVRFDGALLNRFQILPEAAGPIAINAYDSNTVFTNEGAGAQVVMNLPTAAAGLTYTFLVQVAQDFKIVASGGDTLRLAGTVSAAAGFINSANVGNGVVLVAINATEWLAVSIVGQWNVT